MPQGCHHTFTVDIWPVGNGEMNAIIRQLATWYEASAVVVHHEQFQEKEQIGLTKKRACSLVINPMRVIGEFGLPASS